MNFTDLGRGSAVAIVALGVAVASQASAQMSPSRPTQNAMPDGTINQNQLYQGPANQGSEYKIPLSEVNDPETTLAKANIRDHDGNWVASVHRVVMGAGGTPNAIDADVGGYLGSSPKVVALTARHLSYEKDRNVLITDLSRDEIKALPAV